MTSDMAHGEAEQPEVRHPLPSIGPRQYVIIGVILTVITAIELWVSYSSLGNLIIPILLTLSAVKFAVVVAFFMHLRFDSPVLARFFAFGLILAAAILFALIALFWNDATLAGGRPEVAAEGTSGEAAGGGEAASGGEAAGGGTAVDVVLADFSITPSTDAVTAGSVEFDARNEGGTPHELMVIKTDLPADQLPVAGATVDEDQIDAIGEIEEFPAGASAKGTLELEPGSYVLICNVPGHYQLGMHTEFTVR